MIYNARTNRPFSFCRHMHRCVLHVLVLPDWLVNLDRDITLRDLKITIGKFEENKQCSSLSVPAIRYYSFEATPVECDLDEDVSAVIVFTSAN